VGYQGFDVFVMELQGSGRSPRPKIDDPCNANPAQQGVLIPDPLSAPCSPVSISRQSTSDPLVKTRARSANDPA